MMILSDKCKKCHYTCSAIHFQQNFGSWTSSNNDIDKFIQDTQLLAHDAQNALEWIPYNIFRNINYIEKIGVYKGNWMGRFNQNEVITLKSLNNTKNATLESINEV
jgi:hypothetical protein